LAGKKWSHRSHTFIITCGPKMRNALPSSAKTMARLEQLISLVPSLGCHRQFLAIRIIFSGDREIGMAKLLWCSTRGMTTSASNSPQSKIWAKSWAVRGRCLLNAGRIFISVAIWRLTCGNAGHM